MATPHVETDFKLRPLREVAGKNPAKPYYSGALAAGLWMYLAAYWLGSAPTVLVALGVVTYLLTVGLKKDGAYCKKYNTLYLERMSHMDQIDLETSNLNFPILTSTSTVGDTDEVAMNTTTFTARNGETNWVFTVSNDKITKTYGDRWEVCPTHVARTPTGKLVVNRVTVTTPHPHQIRSEQPLLTQHAL